MAGVLSKNDKELEPIVFELFRQGRTVNQIAKECLEMAKLYPDHKKRVEKVNNWHKKFKKLIMLGISTAVTNNIAQSIERDEMHPVNNRNIHFSNISAQVDETNSHSFGLAIPQIWSEQLKVGAMAKAEHKDWVKENILPVEKEFYLEWYKTICAEVRDRIKAKKIDSDCKVLINLCLRLASELKKSPSFPSYIQESIAYLNMLKSEEGAIAAGFIQRKVKVLEVNQPQNLEEEVEEIKSLLGYETENHK